MSGHGNSLQNPNPHHLYEIRDNKDDDVFKYGISDEPIGSDGMSKRMRSQIDILNNAVGWLRFIAAILLTKIPGRSKAKELEDAYIDQYFDKHGRNPRGNPVGGTRLKR
jgi:URI fold toxin 2